MAKSGKQAIHELLDTFRPTLKIVSQYDLIAVCVKALKNVSREAWIGSFRKVNLHPDFCDNSLTWLKQTDKKLNTGELFFTGLNTSLLQAMPAFWQ